MKNYHEQKQLKNNVKYDATGTTGNIVNLRFAAYLTVYIEYVFDFCFNLHVKIYFFIHFIKEANLAAKTYSLSNYFTLFV